MARRRQVGRAEREVLACDSSKRLSVMEGPLPSWQAVRQAHEVSRRPQECRESVSGETEVSQERPRVSGGGRRRQRAQELAKRSVCLRVCCFVCFNRWIVRARESERGASGIRGVESRMSDRPLLGPSPPLPTSLANSLLLTCLAVFALMQLA